MKFKSILRTEEENFFSTLKLSGKVLDLGGINNSHYHNLIKGEFEIVTVNFSKSVECDVVHDLEETPLPFSNLEYDAVILNNTLEHIYHVQELVRDSIRVLKKGGKIIITIPFLFPEHPSPHDYWRFTGESIQKILEDNTVSKITINPLGTGVFTVCYHFFERLLPVQLRVLTYLLRPFVYFLDTITYATLTRRSKQKREYHSLGYFIVGIK